MKSTFVGVMLVMAFAQGAWAETSAEEVGKDAHRALDSGGRYVDEHRKTLEADLQKRLEGVEKELRELKQSAEKHGKEAQSKLDEQVRSLEGREKELTQKLAELKASTESAWTKLRSGLEKALEDLEAKVQGSKKKEKLYRL